MNAADARNAAGALMRRATYASLAVAGTMILVKLGAWLMTDSVSLLSSLLDSLLDAASSLVNLVAVHQALIPPDREHRFGHGKAEPLASLGQAAFITGSAAVLMIQALQHMLTPQPVSNTGVGIAVMVFAILVTLVLVVYQRSVVHRTGSLVVSADEFHYRADLILNGGVIISLLATATIGWVYLDPIFGAAIGFWIIYGAWRVGMKAVVQLMDRELPDDVRARIRRIALEHPQVRSVHDLRTRAAGPTAFIQIHLEMDGKLTLNEAHRISDAVEADILAAFPQSEVMIHQDPEGVEEPRRSFPPASASSRLAS
jgi:ferrous-iron efflux pump FieF